MVKYNKYNSVLWPTLEFDNSHQIKTLTYYIGLENLSKKTFENNLGESNISFRTSEWCQVQLNEQLYTDDNDITIIDKTAKEIQITLLANESINSRECDIIFYITNETINEEFLNEYTQIHIIQYGTYYAYYTKNDVIITPYDKINHILTYENNLIINDRTTDNSNIFEFKLYNNVRWENKTDNILIFERELNTNTVKLTTSFKLVNNNNVFILRPNNINNITMNTINLLIKYINNLNYYLNLTIKNQIPNNTTIYWVFTEKTDQEKLKYALIYVKNTTNFNNIQTLINQKTYDRLNYCIDNYRNDIIYIPFNLDFIQRIDDTFEFYRNGSNTKMVNPEYLIKAPGSLNGSGGLSEDFFYNLKMIYIIKTNDNDNTKYDIKKGKTIYDLNDNIYASLYGDTTKFRSGYIFASEPLSSTPLPKALDLFES